MNGSVPDDLPRIDLLRWLNIFGYEGIRMIKQAGENGRKWAKYLYTTSDGLILDLIGETPHPKETNALKRSKCHTDVQTIPSLDTASNAVSANGRPGLKLCPDRAAFSDRSLFPMLKPRQS